MEISLGVLFKGFNASKFCLYLSLLIFLILFTLRLDQRTTISYIFIFIPLWACHLMVFIGCLVGIISFCVRPPSRNDILVRNDFVAMLLTTAEHVFLLAFDTLVFYKLEYGPKHPEHMLHWTVVFSPLFALSIVSLGIAVWALKHEKSLEFEFLYAINIIQFFFISFKLDDQVDWSWAVVFIPLWVVLSLSAVGVLYALILSIVLARSRHLMPSHRRQHLYSAVLHTFLVIPALISLILLTTKLDAVPHHEKHDDTANMPYCAILFPLWISLILMMIMSFGGNGGNIWWYGMRRPFCTFLLDMFPCLGQYANVSYRIGATRSPSANSTPSSNEEVEKPLHPIMPLVTIECPD